MMAGLISALVLTGMPTSRAAGTGRLAELSLEDLAKVTVTTTTIDATPWMTQPAKMSVLRSQDIESLGAKNLQEIMDFVPGFANGVDVFGANSLIVRGNWAHEGKVMLLLDDMPLNDLLYGNVNLAEHYPAAQIERVEIVRGAGTARYGGNAELAVIRLYTRAPQASGTTLTLGSEAMRGAGSGQQATLTSAFVKDDLALTLSGYLARLPYSGETWRDNAGRTFALGDLTGIEAGNFLAKLDWRDLHLRYFDDRHVSRSPQKFGYGQLGEQVKFASQNWSADYQWKVNDRLTIIPRYWQRRQQDWFIARDPQITPVVNFFLPARAAAGSLEAQYKSDRFDLVTGIEHRNEGAFAASPGGPPGVRDANTYFNGHRSASYHSSAAYAQLDWNQGPWLATAGIRYSRHNFAGSSLVPRAALTYDRESWRLKLIAGQAFREPNIEVINSSDLGAPPIKPETTTQLEVEADWQPAPDAFGSVSIFNLRIADPIIYSSTGTDYFYNNNPAASTRGLELDWHQQIRSGRVNLGYSYYQAQSVPGSYAVPQDRHSLLGAPQQKAFAALDLTLPAKAWHLRGAVVWYSAFYAADYQSGASDELGNELTVQRQPASTRVNVSLRYAAAAWNFSAGIDNLFASPQRLGQPYRSESTPYPGPGRRFWITLNRDWE